jgi:methylated-DNA-[protein]-cysteine S-methyltransferase
MNLQQPYCIFATAWGYFGFCTEAGMIKRTCLPCEEVATVEQSLFGAGRGRPEPGLMPHAQQLIQAYFQGEPSALHDMPLCHAGQTAFCQDLYEALRKVPSGRTVSYGELADLAGHPGAARAVGRAMSVNPTPLIVPCHRVVNASGRLGGFSAHGGVDMKKRLLDHENAFFS